MIELQDISISIQGTAVLSNVNLKIEPKFGYLLTGDNGSGKTTLLNLMVGKIQPQEGSIHYSFIDESLDWEQRYELRKSNIHYIPTHAIHDLMNSPDVYYQQRYYTIEETPIPKVKDYFGERLHKIDDFHFPGSFDIHSLLELPLTSLSNGQFKKIIILKQLLDNLPKVLLLDYPFEGLDLISRKELKEFLDHLAEHYTIQLIIADHEHDQLPKALKKKIVLSNTKPDVSDPHGMPSYDQNDILQHPRIEEVSTEPVVEMRDVKIQYGDRIIIQNLNWKINRGERWALTGRNGSGKTTLFSLIYADHPMAYSEKVYLFGKRRGTGESIWDIKKRISYLGPEQLHFLDHTTTMYLVSDFLNAKNELHEKLERIIEYFHIKEILTKRLRQLSNGQLQLVLLISLFISRKELLLLDEPFQFLDPVQKARVCLFLNSFLDQSTTLVLITHYEGDVARWTNHRLKL